MNGLVELDAFPPVVFQNRRMSGIQPRRGLEALALAAGVARLLNGVAGDRHLAAAHGKVSERDPHAAAAAHIVAQRVFEGGGTAPISLSTTKAYLPGATLAT